MSNKIHICCGFYGVFWIFCVQRVAPLFLWPVFERRNKMKISLLTIGAMGDTQPFVALAVRLKQQGHAVRLAARPDFAPLAAAYDIEFAPLGNTYKSLLRNEEVATAIGSGNMLRMLIKQASDTHQRQAFFEGLDRDTLGAVSGAQAIIYKSSWLPFLSIAEKLGVPAAAAMFMPLTPTRDFPSFLIGGGKDRGMAINSLNWLITEQLIWQVARSFDNKLRHNMLGLKQLPFFGPSARRLARTPLYYAYSPTVLPRPADWPERILVTGYWQSAPPPGWTPPAELVAFLESGPPPVYVGFSSMPSGNAQNTLKIILKALELSRQRGVLLAGWAGIGEGTKLPDYAFGIQSIPHGWLFPRVHAVVHHGGAGTTGAGLCAGVPSVITPFVADQPNWARRVEALGVGPRPIAFAKLTAELLANALHETSGHAMRQRAADLGKLLRSEDGVGTTIDSFAHYCDARA
jgi:UDP:flavonoid glycosyltransferase YjiC (YdhE family)